MSKYLINLDPVNDSKFGAKDPMEQALKTSQDIAPEFIEPTSGGGIGRIDDHTAELARDQTNNAHQRWRAEWMAGPTAIAWKELPVQVGDPAPMTKVTDLYGAPFSLRKTWENGPALLVFLRHFACDCTWRRLERLATEVEKYAPGTTVYAIGQGEPERTKLFAADYKVTVPLLCDPERNAYRAFGILEGQSAQIIYTNALDGQGGLQLADTFREQGRVLVDSPWQLGAEFVVNAAGVITLAHRYQRGDDFPSIELLTAAIEKAARA